jgi:hypothetical protein
VNGLLKESGNKILSRTFLFESTKQEDEAVLKHSINFSNYRRI